MTPKKKKVIIVFIIIFIIVMGIIFGIYIFNKKNNNYNSNTNPTITSKENKINNERNLTEVEKEIVGIDEEASDDTEIKEENYSGLYKDYLKLSEQEQEKSEIVPRKQEIPFEKLEEIKKTLDNDTKINNQKDNKNETINKTEKEQKSNDEKTEKEQKDNNKKSDNDKQKEQLEIPNTFNLANEINIKVEHQGNFGLCWDFASIKSLETYLALNNIGDYDLSEIHLDYIESDLMYGNRTIHQGGNFSNFKRYISESGVVLEKDAPYRDHTEEEYSKFNDIKKVVEVTETVEFPTIYKSEDAEYTEQEIKEFRELVKKHIMKNGGLYSVIATPDYGTKYLNTTTNAECYLGDNMDYLQSGREFHAVTVVGWDDNYSKDNFNEGMRPKNDGAYIILNSWGKGYGNEGYYYVSYEDKYIESDLSGIVSTSLDNAYKISSIKNQAIKNYLIDNYKYLFINYDGEDYVTKNLISNIYDLDLSNRKMNSIEGIEIFNNLYSLDLSNNNITDITPITQLTNLSTVNLSNNNITDISSFSNMKTKNLYSIDLSNNKIKDVSNLKDIEFKYEDMFLDLDISNNPNVSGIEKLDNLWSLNISNCNIKDISFLQNCSNLVVLKVANTSGIKGLQNLPEKLNELDISNCGIDSLLEIKNTLSDLNLSKNNLSNLEGIQDFKQLYRIDLSENNITDWSSLKEIVRENLNLEKEDSLNFQNENDEEIYEYYDEYYDGLSIIANNCNIEDITIFNDINIQSLELKNNNIKDVSQFNNNNVYSINLSDNENLKGIQVLNKRYSVFLNNCNINDISEILTLDNVYNLSLEDNNITDITGLSNLKKLSTLSLAGNRNIQGVITSDTLDSLNVSGCNLDDTFDFSKMSNLYYLNISNNPNIKNFEKFAKNGKDSYFGIIIDEMNYEDYEKIQSYNNSMLYFNVDTVNLNYKLTNNKIDLNNYKTLKREIMKNMAYGQIKVKNGNLNKNGYIIDINNTNEDSIEIEFLSWPQKTVKIMFDSGLKKNTTNTNTNTIKSTNTVSSNTSNNATNKVIDNSITNDISYTNNTNINTNTDAQNTLKDSTNTNVLNTLKDDTNTKEQNVLKSSTNTNIQNKLNTDANLIN